MKVLIPVDVACGQSASVNAAVTRTWPAETRFCLLHVLVPLYPPVPRLFENAKIPILQKLNLAARMLEKGGWNVRTELVEGSPGRSINAFAREWHADLVMVGSHERSLLGRVCLGGTAQSVMRHAPCSVEVVRPPNDGPHGQFGLKILAATDGSEFSAIALRSVASRPWPEGSELRVISVPEFILVKDPLYLEAHSPRDSANLGAGSIDDAKQCIAAAQHILTGCPLVISFGLPKYGGRPYEVILREAEEWHADLIVVGSHGRSGFDRVVMGSVSEAIALHAKCSVEIIRNAALAREYAGRLPSQGSYVL